MFRPPALFSELLNLRYFVRGWLEQHLHVLLAGLFRLGRGGEEHALGLECGVDHRAELGDISPEFGGQLGELLETGGQDLVVGGDRG